MQHADLTHMCITQNHDNKPLSVQTATLSEDPELEGAPCVIGPMSSGRIGTEPGRQTKRNKLQSLREKPTTQYL